MMVSTANFSLPEVGQLFDSVEFSEAEHVTPEDAEKLVEKYKKEARDQLPPPEKRFRDSRYSGESSIAVVGDCHFDLIFIRYCRHIE